MVLLSTKEDMCLPFQMPSIHTGRRKIVILCPIRLCLVSSISIVPSNWIICRCNNFANAHFRLCAISVSVIFNCADTQSLIVCNQSIFSHQILSFHPQKIMIVFEIIDCSSILDPSELFCNKNEPIFQIHPYPRTIYVFHSFCSSVYQFCHSE